MTPLVQSGIPSWEPRIIEASGLAHAIEVVRGKCLMSVERSTPLRPFDTFTVRLASFELSGTPTDEGLRDDELFDLVVATNVFVYYDTFEQALAVVNVGRMLRSGGSLLANQAVRPVAPMKPAVGHDTIVYSDRQFDHMFWYQRQ